MARNLARQLSQSARLLLCASSVLSDPGHFGETTTTLRVPIGALPGDYRLESAVVDNCLSCCCDHGLDANKSEFGPRHDLSPRVWVRMTSNPRLIHTTDDR